VQKTIGRKLRRIATKRSEVVCKKFLFPPPPSSEHCQRKKNIKAKTFLPLSEITIALRFGSGFIWVCGSRLGIGIGIRIQEGKNMRGSRLSLLA
jgi:hypothetical protein